MSKTSQTEHKRAVWSISLVSELMFAQNLSKTYIFIVNNTFNLFMFHLRPNPTIYSSKLAFKMSKTSQTTQKQHGF